MCQVTETEYAPAKTENILVIFLNLQNWACLKANNHYSLHLARKCAQIFVHEEMDINDVIHYVNFTCMNSVLRL